MPWCPWFFSSNTRTGPAGRSIGVVVVWELAVLAGFALSCSMGAVDKSEVRSAISSSESASAAGDVSLLIVGFFCKSPRFVFANMTLSLVHLGFCEM